MFVDADYQNLARTLVQIYGDQALPYAQRNVESLRLESGDSDQTESWIRVAGIVERLVAINAKRRRNDDGTRDA